MTDMGTYRASALSDEQFMAAVCDSWPVVDATDWEPAEDSSVGLLAPPSAPCSVVLSTTDTHPEREQPRP